LSADFSPLGRGWLTGSLRSPADIPEGDFRRSVPQLQTGNFEQNLALADEVRALADEKGVQPAQLALAWVLDLGPDVVPTFGTRRAANVAALDVRLTADDRARLDALAPKGAAAADCWPAALMAQLNR
jgi:aryl-alcohol dehydrogenase-like predicted oxidoreductase